jgi:hypothetical protein
MFTLLSSILGFMSAGLPNVLHFFQDKNDKTHELAMMKIQTDREIELAKENGRTSIRTEEIKLSEVESKGFFDEKVALYAHDEKIGIGASTWVTNLRASVRPVITYGMFGVFIFVEVYSCYYGWQHAASFNELTAKIWSDETQIVWASILSFWFGSRAFSKK